METSPEIRKRLISRPGEIQNLGTVVNIDRDIHVYAKPLSAMSDPKSRRVESSGSAAGAAECEFLDQGKGSSSAFTREHKR